MSTTRDRVDPQSRVPLEQLLEALPGGFNAVPDIVQRRATMTAMLAAMEIPANENVMQEDRIIPGPVGEPDISVRITRPKNADGPSQAFTSSTAAGWCLVM